VPAPGMKPAKLRATPSAGRTLTDRQSMPATADRHHGEGGHPAENLTDRTGDAYAAGVSLKSRPRLGTAVVGRGAPEGRALAVVPCDAGGCRAAGGVPTRAVSGTGGAGEANAWTVPLRRARVDCTGQGRGRLRGLCLTVIVKLVAILWGNMPLAASGAVVVSLTDPSVGPNAIAARAFVTIEEHRKTSRRGLPHMRKAGPGLKVSRRNASSRCRALRGVA
jgi:hypothetical protein